MVHTWDTDPRDCGEAPGLWAEQRLYVDKDRWARLCRLKPTGSGPKDERGMVQVEFQRCHALQWLPEKDLHWPDFTSVDQKWNLQTWQTVVHTKSGKDKVEPPQCDCLEHAHPGN
ncbi:hypothetical protein CYMTET_41071 [Cymbomonas tetramitiformis]|uniref:Uncharacterized protein n=1 Tax=Cymbomonas tetramitiformis TaxID=36881 RepID=A0AAE0F2M4_9CHLO|nr:hypothetical protein CYMTET_41071 [Cymbomonas tetramitiformis]